MAESEVHKPKQVRAKKKAAATPAPEAEAPGNGGAGVALVIVESPTKARTIGRILGNRYNVIASMGHVSDLPTKRLGVEVLNEFQPEYVVSPSKITVVRQIKEQAASASAVYLATDPDREGEAISWHVAEKAGIPQERRRRVVFHEITEGAVRDAFQHPRSIDMRLVNAQQARRILDRLVGYELSPLLSRKIQRGLSAGRVQSVALRLVVERDRVVEAFIPVEYWTIDALFQKRDGAAEPLFRAALYGRSDDKERMGLSREAAAQAVLAELQGAAYAVEQVAKREVRRRPSPPFITSTLQQEANRKLRWSASRTMTVAQRLYEGVPLGPAGSTGLITYMRTDSTDVAASALSETRDHIGRHYGVAYLPDAPRVYTKKVKGAQEAHEAVRPSSVQRTPESVRAFLSPEQFRLYDLIWKRMVASQMNDALLDATQVDILATPPGGAPYRFRASGSVLKFPGFRTLYLEGSDEAAEDELDARLPELARGDALSCQQLEPKQHFTEPPRRFTEASLIKSLEERGIGRPSTYASIIGTLVARSYVTKERGSLLSTALGRTVNDQLLAYFPKVMDLDFTARMEEELDDIASGEREWVPVLHDFYDPFAAALNAAKETMPRVRVEEPSDETCELCGRPMVIKTGRFGRFLSCSGYPECANRRPLVQRTGVECPKCGGDLVQRKARKGRYGGSTFYGCSNYPACNFSVNSRPLQEPCPECDGLLIAAGRKGARCTTCAYRVDELVSAGAEDAG
ncbi:MAG: type I DNA topoisomerase [Dehalococcoidia bacterium]|nr:type I DNA topoisomerase [Dehalococcoidia bacterium]